MKKKLPIYEEHVNLNVCAGCGGECCKIAPGMATPEDFGASSERGLMDKLMKVLATGRWSIEAGPQTPGMRGNYIVRPAIQGHERTPFDTETFGTCTFWDRKKGCTIFDTRPTGCRILAPSIDRNCVITAKTERDLQDSWLEYRDMLRYLSGVRFFEEAV